MKKIAQGIVRLRKLILTAAILLLIPSAIGAIATRINYDVLTYLPQELDSMIGEQILENDFHLASTGMITVEGLPTNELIAMKKEIEAVPGVTQAFWLSDVLDPSVPKEMLPADVQQFMFGKNDSTMLIVRFDGPSASDETMNAVGQIKKVLRKDCFFGGISVILQDTKALINREMPLYILCAVGASLLVLFLSLESTITPLLFMLGLLFPIVYNFGTNIFLGQISYITEALSTVLQLGVTMDFSIFLLHRYQEEKELRSSNEEAMVSAICKTMTSISASSLTTIAGFLALCAMRLTLGRDIGLVMAKGVALGVICTVVILPALILTFDKWVEKYKHRTVIPRLTKLSYFVSKHAAPIVAIFLVLLVPFAVAQNKTEVYYTLFDSLPQDLTGIVGTNKLGEDFGMTTSHFILVHDDLSATQVSDLCDELKDIDGCTQARFFFQIALPLSKAIIAILVLYYGVGHWNSYFSALVYISDKAKYPLQLVLRNILITNQTALSQTATTAAARAALQEKQQLIDVMKYSLIIISSIPVLVMYPLVQKHFVKGVMIGSMKG